MKFGLMKALVSSIIFINYQRASRLSDRDDCYYFGVLYLLVNHFLVFYRLVKWLISPFAGLARSFFSRMLASWQPDCPKRPYLVFYLIIWVLVQIFEAIWSLLRVQLLSLTQSDFGLAIATNFSRSNFVACYHGCSPCWPLRQLSPYFNVSFW